MITQINLMDKHLVIVCVSLVERNENSHIIFNKHILLNNSLFYIYSFRMNYMREICKNTNDSSLLYYILYVKPFCPKVAR